MKALIPFVGVKNVEKTVCFDIIVKSIKPNGKVKSAKFKVHAWANLVSRGVREVRRSDHEMKRNAVRPGGLRSHSALRFQLFSLKSPCLKKSHFSHFIPNASNSSSSAFILARVSSSISYRFRKELLKTNSLNLSIL